MNCINANRMVMKWDYSTKMRFLLMRTILFFCFFIIQGSLFAQEQVVDYSTATPNKTFIIPYGVSEFKVECWGAGGAGGARSTNGNAGGGGGGAYASSVLDVTFLDSYSVTIGAGGTSLANGTKTDGGFSSFGELVKAAGGNSVARNIGNGAAGGSADLSTGDNKHSGGDGATGGGGVAGPDDDGSDANGRTGGIGYGPLGYLGNGANRPTNNNQQGNPGNLYGGGGSGARRRNGSYNGGAGADGFVRITYTTTYTTFFYESGNVNSTASWKDNGGNSPVNFTTDNQVLCLKNGANVSLSGNFSISGENSVLFLGEGATLNLGGYDLTIGEKTRIENKGNGMVLTNGTGVLKKQGAINSDFNMLYPIGTSGNYAPVSINNFSVTTIASGAYIQLNTVGTEAPGIIGTNPLKRYWVSQTNGLTGSILADISFGYGENDLPVGSTNMFDLLVSSDNGASWSYPNGVGISGSNPLRAKTATDLDAIWTATIPDKKIWYSTISGDWDNPNVWTLDPSGAQYNNPNGSTPTTSSTSELDEVVILSGCLVNVTQNSKKNKSLTVFGNLNLGTTTSHEFSLINGSGFISIAADNFPAGDATNFVTKGLGEGTVEYYGTSKELTIPRTFFNMKVNMAAESQLTMLSDYTINGNLTVTSGNLKINSTATAPLTINIYGDVNVEPAGSISTGTGNARHQLNLYGDFTNRGLVNFSNRTEPNYTSQANNGIVDVNFLNTTKDQSILCRNITNFYRIGINKGEDATYVLNIDALASSYFNLFGFANENHSETTPQLIANNNAIGLVAGTVRIGNGITIANISAANNYVVSEKAHLLVDGGTLLKNSGSAIMVYGALTTNSGTLEAKIQNGIVLCGNGTFNVSGGISNVNQIRVSDVAGSHNGSYVQSGGQVNVLGGTINTDFYAFTLPYPTSVFNMSGGTLKVATPEAHGGIFINSSAENTHISGGNVIADAQGNTDFRLNSTVPFWNLTLKNSTATTKIFRVEAVSNISASNISLSAQPLKILNDFRLFGKESGGLSYPVVDFNPGVVDVYIGGSLYVEDGAKYTAISGGTAPYDSELTQPTTRNTTFFNKTAGTGSTEVLYVGSTVDPLELGNLVVDRTSGYQLVTTSKTGASGRTNESIVVDVNGTTSVESGILSQGLYTIRTWGAIVNHGRMGTWIPGTTPERAQIKLMENSNLSFTTDKDAVFGNIQIDINPPAMLELTSDTYVERLEYVKGLIYIKNYILKVDYLWNLNQGLFENYQTSSDLNVANNTYSGSSMIFTNGNAGDGGLSLKITQNSLSENETNRLNNFGPVTYPMGFTPDNGTTLYFRPAQIVVKDFADDGYITIRPVSGYLQTANQEGKALQHYWRVTHSDFATKPTVSLRFYYRNRRHGTTNVVDLFNTSDAEESRFMAGKVLDDNPYTRSHESVSDITRTSQTRKIVFNGTSENGLFTPAATGITLENANYTAGEQTRFSGSVRVFYSIDEKDEAMWNSNNAWSRSDNLNAAYSPHDSRQNRAGMVPGAGDVAVIGWIPWDEVSDKKGQPHSIWVTDSREVAEVVFTKMTDIDGNPVPRAYRSNFQFRPTLTINGRDNYDEMNGTDNGVLRVKLVKGEGLFWNRQTDPDYTLMDIGDFAREDSSYVIYENFTTNRIINKSADLFPNLYISNDDWGRNDHNFMFSRNVETTGNIELLGDVNLILPNNATGDITVGRNLIMFTSQNSEGGAEIRYANSGTARTIDVKGDLLMINAGSKISVASPNAGDVTHNLCVEGNIVLGVTGRKSSGLQLWTANNMDRISLYLNGNNSMTYTAPNSDTSNFYRIIVNKGASKTTTASFDAVYRLNGPTSGVGVPKALEILNGTFIHNANCELVLSSGNDYFSIPSTGGLTLKQGSLRVSGNSGILLDGVLTIDNGTLEMGGAANHIEYTASGNSSIIINGGTVNIGGQIHRSTTTNDGALDYIQTAGDVAIGLFGAPINSRGVFEILNAGSSFTFTNGTLSIVRSQNNPEIPAFYFDPSTYYIGNNSTISIGHNSTPEGQTIGIYAAKNLPRLRVMNGSANNPIAKLEIVPATITSLLTIDEGATFDANGLDLILKGDLNVFGSFKHSGNTTFFSGTSAQSITGNNSTISFFNFDKTTSNKVSLNGTSAPLLVENSLFIRNGELAANSNNITLKGDIRNNGVHSCNNAVEYGILMAGDKQQIIRGEGTFGKLSIRNSSGVVVPSDAINNITIANSLKMIVGVLNIGHNYLNLGINATIEETSPFSIYNMITTNISFNDNGVRKYFRAGTTNNFIYPVGSGNKFTPVTLDITSNANSTGSITVVPANEMHPSIIEDTETGAQIVDADNALKYYWTLKSDGISGFSGNAKMKYVETDVAVTVPYTVENYITARLLLDGSGNWDKYENSHFDEASKTMNFTYSGVDDDGISGDYTAGAVDNTKNGAIPDKVAEYQTNNSGAWSEGSIWTPNIAGGPRGAIAKINSGHVVDVLSNGISGYKTQINGRLNINSTIDHRLGIVEGNGKIYSQIGSIPAAVYEKFFSSTGGTIEFGGNTDYELLGNVMEVNNLEFSGTGRRNLPNNNLLTNGNFILNGDATMVVANNYNKTITVKGNISRGSGTFSAGTGSNAAVILSGEIEQIMSGTFTGSSAFNNLEIKNSNDVSVTNDIEINNQLVLTNGIFEVSDGVLFKLNYPCSVSPAGGSQTSFISGEFTKELMSGNSFTFPVGDKQSGNNYGKISLNSVQGPSGINNWATRYYYRPTPITESFEEPITSISHVEYWSITAPTGGQSFITIALDGSNDVANTIENLSNLRIVGFNIAKSAWEVVGSGSTFTGSSTNGTISTTARVNFGTYSYFTIGSITPLDASSASFTSAATINLCNGDATELVVAFSGKAPWVLTYNDGTTNIVTSPIASSPYRFNVSPNVGTTTYRLISVSANGIPGALTGITSVNVIVGAIPTIAISTTSDNTICEGEGLSVFNATAGLSNYKFRVNGVVVQNSASSSMSYLLQRGVNSIDVVGTSANGCYSTSSALTINVNPLPDASGAITGNVSVCNNTTNTYSVSSIANATSYFWSVVGSGATITSGQGTNTVSIRFTNSGSKSIKVVGRNACGDGVESTIDVAVNTASVAGNATTITGDAQVCKGGSGTFQTPVITNATSYIWEYSGTGATIVGTGNTVTVNFANDASNGNLTVRGTNGCNTGNPSTPFAITVNTPPTISFDDETLEGCGGTDILINSSISGGQLPYTYAWSGTGTEFLSNEAINNPILNSNPTEESTYYLTLIAVDAKGCSSEGDVEVKVYEAPVAFAGPDALDICSGSEPIALTGATATGSYTGSPIWSVSDASGTFTQSINPALAIFTPEQISGETDLTLTLTGSNGCVNVSDSRHIKWSSVPNKPALFTESTASVCKGSNYTFTVPNDDFVNMYHWSYSGTNVTLEQNVNSVSISFSETATSGKLSVYGSNACGNGAPLEIDIVVNDIPAIPQIVEATYCAGSDFELNVVDSVGMATLWTVNAPFSISGNVLSVPDNDVLFPVENAELVIYPSVKVVVTNINGCKNEVTNDSTNKFITIIRIPRTGPQYHIPNN